MIKFLLGLICGIFMGAVAIALCVAAKKSDEIFDD